MGQLIELAGFSGRFKEVLAVAERADAGGSSWDAQQLASLYLAAGDKKKAAAQQLKWAEQMIQQGNGSWAMRQTMDQLAQMELWDEAEQFVAKHRTDNMDQWEAEEFDRSIAARYVTMAASRESSNPCCRRTPLKAVICPLSKRLPSSIYRPINRLNAATFWRSWSPPIQKIAISPSVWPQLYNQPGDLPKRLTLLKPFIQGDASKQTTVGLWRKL